MEQKRRDTLARLLSLLIPAALLAGAYGSQYLGGLFPCEMCHWQRWPHWAAIGLAVGAFLSARTENLSRLLVLLAALAIFTSGAIGAWHAGIEAGVFPGVTGCSSAPAGDDLLAAVMSRPMIRCDEIQFSFLGVSMAGWNAILSITSALVIAWLCLKRPSPRLTA